MTREEAKQILSDWNLCHYTPSKEAAEAVISAIDPLEIISALHSPTREMVERMRGEWIPAESDFDDDDTLFDVDDWCDWQCSACHSEICYDDPMERRWLPKFCPNCGAPMKDEAVDIELRRWKEAVDNADN